MEETRQHPSEKRPKLSDGEQYMASIDWFSSLPDVVILHILSFLETKFSVATSVLGKRWRFLWAHVPCLDFSEDNFREKGIQNADIIHRVLLQHKAKRIETLNIDRVHCNEYQLETLITTAIDRSIRNLHLEIEYHTFPRYVFNCKTIVELKLLSYEVSLSDVGNVSLPSLKKFDVSNVVCENDEALPHFLSGCPSLEELDMGFTHLEENDYAGCINISSPTIKTLALHLHCLTCPSNLKYRMIINAPALRCLQVYNCDLECITVPITMVSLVKAHIDLQSCNSMLVKFLHSLCYAKCLEISGWKFEEFVHGGVAFSDVKFHNLIKLELQLDFKWSLLVKFLEVADNLQVLICQQVYHQRGYLCPEPEQVPKCLLSCLRTITILNMQSEEHEFDMVKYLLKNSRVLKRMKLFYVCSDLKTKFQALKRISLFERGSDVCQLDFLPDC